MIIAFSTAWSNHGDAKEIKKGPSFSESKSESKSESSSESISELIKPVSELIYELQEELQEFRLNDGSTVSVDYHHGKISIEMGESGPKMLEDFKEDDFGGIYWDWGQITPQTDGTWIYEDWLNEGYKSEAIPIPLL